MFDTIVIMLHDLKYHEQILNSVRLMQRGFRKFEMGGTLHGEFLLYDDTNRSKEKFIYRTRLQPSSNYDVTFIADKFKDAFTFAFSIPKYFYGHNVAQAVLNTNEVNFSLLTSDATLETQISNGLERLKKYIATFLDNEFPGCRYDTDKIELKRLDFCFNQIFTTKRSALSYLEVQKNISKKFLRDGSTQMKCYDTSIFCHNQDYSVKIYHKGSEYEKNDAKEHQKINARKGSEYFNIPYLQEHADKVLRYEITIRPSYMSYLYNKNIFRKNSSQFILWRKIFNVLKNIENTNKDKIFFTEWDRIRTYQDVYEKFKDYKDKDTSLTMWNWLRYYYTKRTFKEKITFKDAEKYMRRFKEDFDTLMNYRRKFFFSMDDQDKMQYDFDNRTNVNKFDTFKHVIFGKQIFELMAGKLVQFMKDFRVEKQLPTIEYLRKIDEHNEKIEAENKVKKGLPSFLQTKKKSKIDKAKVGLLLAALENYSLDQLHRQLGVSRMTIHRYQATLKEIGYSKHTVSKTDLEVPDLNFERYYYETTLNQYKMFNNQFFKLKDWKG